jgi:hypothetical protein
VVAAIGGRVAVAGDEIFTLAGTASFSKKPTMEERRVQ